MRPTALLIALILSTAAFAQDANIAPAAEITTAPAVGENRVPLILDGRVETGFAFEVGTSGDGAVTFDFGAPRTVTGLRFFQNSDVYYTQRYAIEGDGDGDGEFELTLAEGTDAPEYLRDAPFVAIPPDILTEAVWPATSRPIDMVAFHGLQTAIETQEREGYRYTNQNALTALGRVTEALIEPYGPALKRINERPGPGVALLLSGANTVFGSIMEGGGTRSLHNPPTAARFGADVLYDEDIKEGALGGYSVLAIPQCRFMLRSVRDRIDEFQRAGGTVLLDSDAMIDIPGAVSLSSRRLSCARRPARFTATEADGSWVTGFPIAENEPAGAWSARVTELIGGHASVTSFEVRLAGE